MRKLLIVFSLLIVSMSSYADGIEFFDGTWEEALAKAQAEDKLIFMDAYTTWCGPCKLMAKKVFTEGSVGEYYNKYFINMKVDMEKGIGPKLAQKYKVRAYPTFLFVDGSGEKVYEAKGAKPAEAFIQIGKAALKKVDKSGDYAKLYEEGNREPETLRKYAYALMQAGKPHLKIANEYFRTQKDWTTPENVKALYDFASEADSRLFTKMIENKSAVLQRVSPDAFNQRLSQAGLNTLSKAIEFQSEDLLDEAKAAVGHMTNKSRAAKAALYFDIKYFGATSNSSKFYKSANKFSKKYAKDDAHELNKLANLALEYFNKDVDMMKKAEVWSSRASSMSSQWAYYYTYTQVLYRAGKKAEAVEAAKKGLELAKEQKGNAAAFQMMIQQMGK